MLLEKYLRTSYRPDCDFIDGEVRKRNVGEIPHSRAMAQIGRHLGDREKEWGIVSFMSARVRVSPTRIRVPDLTVVSGLKPTTRIVENPPLLCIEILSPKDRMSSIQERVDDYLAFGVSCVWVIDPNPRRGFVYTSEGMREAKDGILRVPDSPVAVPLADLG
jgi:Uma2 family endonuclease